MVEGLKKVLEEVDFSLFFGLVWEKPTLQLAKQFGVSDKAIEKWAKEYGIQKPPRGYWTKVKFGKIEPKTV